MKFKITQDFLTFLKDDVVEFFTYSEGVSIHVERVYFKHWYQDTMKENRQSFSINLKRPPVPSAALLKNKYSTADWGQICKRKVIEDMKQFMVEITEENS